MIKLETLGMIPVSHINPLVTAEQAVKNNSFVTFDGATYLISTDLAGDDAYVDGVEFAAGEYLNGYNLGKLVDQILLVDQKHFSNEYESVKAGDTLTIKSDYIVGGMGDYSLVVTEKTRLTEPAVKAKITVSA